MILNFFLLKIKRNRVTYFPVWLQPSKAIGLSSYQVFIIMSSRGLGQGISLKLTRENGIS